MPQTFGPRNYSDLITQLAELKNPTGNITDAESLKGAFDIDPNLTSSVFGSRRRSLFGQRGRSLSSASSRMSGRIANPEAVFSGIEGQFAGALGNLEAEQGNAELNQERYLTQLLYSILQGNSQFEVGRKGMQASALGGKFQEKVYEENKPTWLDDFMAILNSGANVAKAVVKP